MQLPLARQLQELLVGHRAPQEVGESGRQFMIGQLLLRTARAAGRKSEKAWRTQNDAERFPQAGVQRTGVFAGLRPIVHELIQLSSGQRSTKGTRGEAP